MENDIQLENRLKELLEKYSYDDGRLISDNETLHYEVDKLIVEELENLGYTETVKKYKEMRQHFWYA